MKVAVVIAVIFWLICGLIGAWRLEDVGESLHWKTVAWGPLSLAKSFKERPVTYPGPD